MSSTQPTDDARAILFREFGSQPGFAEDFARERDRGNIAQAIYDARHAAGLTQRQLAELIGTRQSVISRLEDADYDGHSLRMVERIAQALDLEVRIEMVPRPELPSPDSDDAAE
jgi:ribosome-binding protein aMBF1 (putative translation factor)